MSTDNELHLAWERMRAGHITKALWYPDPPPRIEGEDINAYTNRLIGYTDQSSGTDLYPYDHRRFRECSIGYHRNCRICGCPCHRLMSFQHSLEGTIDFMEAAAVFSELYYLPVASARQVVISAAAGLHRGWITNHDGLRVRLSREFKSPIGPWFVSDVVSVLAKHAPSLPKLETDSGR